MAAYKEDQQIKDLIEQEGDSNFLFFAQTKHQRMQYLKMQRQSSMMNQMQKMPTNPYVQMMMMRSRMGMGGQGFGGRMGMNPMMGGGRGMNNMGMSMGMGGMGMGGMGMGMNSMGMNSMGMNPMGGMMQGGPSMNPMGRMMQGDPMMQMMGGQMPGMPKMGGQGMPGEMGNNPMQSQNPGQSMNALNSQMKNMNLIPMPHPQATGDLHFEPPSPKFPPIQVEDTPDMSTAPKDQEEWEKIGLNESLVNQKNYIQKFLKEFKALPQTFQTQMLGDLIYSALSEYKLDQEVQGQITGMLNDYEVLSLNEILELLSNKEIMKDRINEALELIQGDKEDDEEEEEEEHDEENN